MINRREQQLVSTLSLQAEIQRKRIKQQRRETAEEQRRARFLSVMRGESETQSTASEEYNTMWRNVGATRVASSVQQRLALDYAFESQRIGPVVPPSQRFAFNIAPQTDAQITVMSESQSSDDELSQLVQNAVQGVF